MIAKLSFVLALTDIYEDLLAEKLELGDIYCCVPARWGLQQTHPGLRAATRHRVRDPLVRSQVHYRSTGEPPLLQ